MLKCQWGKDFAEAVVDLLHLGDHDTNADGERIAEALVGPL